jgi:serine/threonine protein kinase
MTFKSKEDNLNEKENDNGIVEVEENGMSNNNGEIYNNSSSSSNSSDEDDIVGTAEYASPEMLNRKVENNRTTDIWALGCIIYQFFHGKTPFKGDNDFIIFDNILKRKYTVKSDLPEDVQDLIHQLLKENPSDRIGSGGLGSNNDFSALKSHPFFKGINFDKLHSQQVPFQINTTICTSSGKSTKKSSSDSIRNSMKSGASNNSDTSGSNITPFNHHLNLNLLSGGLNKKPFFSQYNSPILPKLKSASNIMDLITESQVEDFSIDTLIEDYPNIIDDFYTNQERNSNSNVNVIKVLREGLVKKVSLMSDKVRKLKLYSDCRLEFWDYKKNVLIGRIFLNKNTIVRVEPCLLEIFSNQQSYKFKVNI